MVGTGMESMGGRLSRQILADAWQARGWEVWEAGWMAGRHEARRKACRESIYRWLDLDSGCFGDLMGL